MIQYNKYVATDSGTYSIDYFTFDFLLLTTVRIFDLLELEIEKRKSSCIKYQHFQTNKFGYSKSVFQCDLLHIELTQNNKMLRMSFNPNHCIDSAVLAFLLRFVRTNCSVIAFRCARCDYTYDDATAPVLDGMQYVGTQLMSLSPVTETNSTGFKAVLLGLLGNYDTIVTVHQYQSGSQGYYSTVTDVQPDYVWLTGAALLLLLIYCLFRLGGALIHG